MTALPVPRTNPDAGPQPGVLALASLGMLIGSLVSMAALSGGGTITSAFGDPETVTGFFADHASAVRLSAMLQLASAVPLGLYAATTYARQSRAGLHGPGLAVALFGGTAAAVLLAVSAIVTWTESQSAVSAEPELTHALAYVSFAAGGFAHVLGLGLLVGGIAVPAMLLGLVPTWFARAGLAIAAVAALSILTMVAEPAQVLIPIGRFGSLIWLVVAGFRLTATHRPGAGA